MKLSDAMEAGWKLAPQSWDNGWGVQDGSGNWVGVCAVGAAILGARPDTDDVDLCYTLAAGFFPELDDIIPDENLPEGVENPHWKGMELGDVIQEMNDRLHRPKDEIVAATRQLGY